MKTKAIFFDIDGTLVSFKTHSIPESTKTAIHQLKEKDIKVFISTGRALCNIDNLEGIEFDGLITLNGTYCVDSKGEIIAHHLLSKESLDKLALYMEAKPFPCVFMTDKGNFINYADDLMRSVYQFVNIAIPTIKPVSEIIEHDVFQLSAFIDSDCETDLLTRILVDCDSSRWHPAFVDINLKNCNKAVGMDSFLAHFDIEREHTMAFGDGGNDISILKHAAIGIAMGNAHDEVKAAADYVTDSVDEDGISNALRYFNILSEEDTLK